MRRKTKGVQQGDRIPRKGEKKACVEQRKKIWGKEKDEGREKTGWESEKEKTQKCGPPGLDADTSERLPRGGARPYGCMAKWNPRGGSGHISLHGALASSALRFAGRTGTLTMTSGSPTSVMAPGSQLTPLAKGQEEEKSPAPPRERRVTYATQ